MEWFTFDVITTPFFYRNTGKLLADIMNHKFKRSTPISGGMLIYPSLLNRYPILEYYESNGFVLVKLDMTNQQAEYELKSNDILSVPIRYKSKRAKIIEMKDYKIKDFNLNSITEIEAESIKGRVFGIMPTEESGITN